MSFAGKHHSPETKSKMAAASRGRRLSDEAKAKISAAHSGKNHWFFGKHHPEEVRAKISASHMGKLNPMYGKSGQDAPAYGRTMTPNIKKALLEANVGRHLTEEHKAKISIANRGKVLSEDHRSKISRSHIGKHMSTETKAKLAIARSGERSSNWRGGISFEPYCPKFNENLKQRVRTFFEDQCLICGKSKEENGKNLSVHHVEYNKAACCDGKMVTFAPLCCECHSRTSNGNRQRWEDMLHRIIDEMYNGRSYFTKEEYMQLLGDGSE